jgi:hypothetical protein
MDLRMSMANVVVSTTFKQHACMSRLQQATHIRTLFKLLHQACCCFCCCFAVARRPRTSLSSGMFDNTFATCLHVLLGTIDTDPHRWPISLAVVPAAALLLTHQASAYFPEQLHEQLVDALLEYGEKQLVGHRALDNLDSSCLAA